MVIVPGLAMADHTVGGRAYLLVDGITCVLIDTGGPDGTLGAGQLIEAAGRKPHEVRLILLTHAHAGHAGNADGLRLLSHAPVASSSAAAAALADPQPTRAPGLWGRFGRRLPAADGVRVDRVLQPGEILDICGGIEVIDAPGHAAGSLAFHCRGIDALVLGDAASVGTGGLVAPPRRQCTDPDQAARTAARLAERRVRVLAPGHGFASVGGALPHRRRG